MKDSEIVASGQGWTLIACHNGENWTLHVENSWGQSASLDAAVNEEEVYCPKARREVPLKAPTIALFGRWFEQYDTLCPQP